MDKSVRDEVFQLTGYAQVSRTTNLVEVPVFRQVLWSSDSLVSLRFIVLLADDLRQAVRFREDSDE